MFARLQSSASILKPQSPDVRSSHSKLTQILPALLCLFKNTRMPSALSLLFHQSSCGQSPGSISIPARAAFNASWRGPNLPQKIADDVFQWRARLVAEGEWNVSESILFAGPGHLPLLHNNISAISTHHTRSFPSLFCLPLLDMTHPLCAAAGCNNPTMVRVLILCRHGCGWNCKLYLNLTLNRSSPLAILSVNTANSRRSSG